MQFFGDDHGDKTGAIFKQLLLKGQLLNEIALASFIHLQSHFGKFLHDLLGALELRNPALMVKKHHIGLVDRALQSHSHVNAFLLFCLFKLAAVHPDHKMNTALRVILPDVVDIQFCLLLFPTRHIGLQELLVVLSPLSQRQLRDLQDCRARLCKGAMAIVLAFFPRRFDTSCETTIPRLHAVHWLLLYELAHVRDNVQGVVVGHGCAPARPDALGSIDQNQRNDRCVPMRLDSLPFLNLVL
mmetsp:Transcript_8373/g.19773  ORF Transcript_8373/g.19773 Transcript_8373/m.19773 type:complete len:242 (-) Transcript_8373:2465-3190(-)